MVSPLRLFRSLYGEELMMDSSLVCIVDDDESVRESLPDLLTVSGFQPHAFSSAEAFLASIAWRTAAASSSTSPCPL